MHLKMSSVKRGPFGDGGEELNVYITSHIQIKFLSAIFGQVTNHKAFYITGINWQLVMCEFWCKYKPYAEGDIHVANSQRYTRSPINKIIKYSSFLNIVTNSQLDYGYQYNYKEPIRMHHIGRWVVWDCHMRSRVLRQKMPR